MTPKNPSRALFALLILGSLVVACGKKEEPVRTSSSLAVTDCLR